MGTSDGNDTPAETRERLWRVDDVLAYFDCSRSWVYQKVASGELPHLNIGGLLRFDPDEIKAWARGRAAKPARVVPIR